MFELFAVVIAVVALAIARKAMDQAASLRARLDMLEASGWRAQPTPPPLNAPLAPEPAGASESATVAAPIEQPAPLHEAPPSVPDDAAADPVGAAPTMPPPPPPAPPGFEERVGT